MIAASLAASTPAPVEGAAGDAERPRLEARFARLDRDGDGFVARGEAPRAARTRCPSGNADAPDWVGRYDADGDGRVSRDEFVGGGPARIAARAE